MAKREIRPIRVEGQVAYVPLTQGYTAIIDAADVPIVDGVNWFARRDAASVYAARTVWTGSKHITVLMHRLISGCADGVIPDHKDGDGLNNRRDNLRDASNSQNTRNSRRRVNNKSGIKGVVLTARGRWQAQIRVNGKDHWLGYHNCRTAAAFAYARASRELHGEFGRIA